MLEEDSPHSPHDTDRIPKKLLLQNSTNWRCHRGAPNNMGISSARLSEASILLDTTGNS